VHYDGRKVDTWDKVGLQEMQRYGRAYSVGRGLNRTMLGIKSVNGTMIAIRLLNLEMEEEH